MAVAARTVAVLARHQLAPISNTGRQAAKIANKISISQKLSHTYAALILCSASVDSAYGQSEAKFTCGSSSASSIRFVVLV